MKNKKINKKLGKRFKLAEENLKGMLERIKPFSKRKFIKKSSSKEKWNIDI